MKLWPRAVAPKSNEELPRRGVTHGNHTVLGGGETAKVSNFQPIPVIYRYGWGNVPGGLRMVVVAGFSAVTVLFFTRTKEKNIYISKNIF